MREAHKPLYNTMLLVYYEAENTGTKAQGIKRSQPYFNIKKFRSPRSVGRVAAAEVNLSIKLTKKYEREL